MLIMYDFYIINPSIIINLYQIKKRLGINIINYSYHYLNLNKTSIISLIQIFLNIHVPFDFINFFKKKKNESGRWDEFFDVKHFFETKKIVLYLNND